MPKRPVSPEAPIVSYPTPNTSDLILVEDVDSRLPGYQVLEYGTPHKNVQKYPGLKLVSQQPLQDTDTFVRRVYAKDRVDQDAYNYAIKYSGGSSDHPIYIRTYILPRKGYTPLASGTLDPEFGGAVYVQEELSNVDDPSLNSLFVKVTRVFETLPGPSLGGKGYKPGLQGITTTTETAVAAGTNPDQLSTTVLESQVVPIDATKSKKTTISSTGPTTLTGVTAKPGLQGKTSVTESIVAAGSAADTLSLTVIQSEVTPIDAYKSKKTTVTSSGPTSQVGKAIKAGVLGKTSVTRSIVANTETPDTLSTSVLSSEIEPIDDAKSRKTTVVSDGAVTLVGYDYDPTVNVFITTTNQVVAAGSAAPTSGVTNPTTGEGNYVLALKDNPIDEVRTLRVTSKITSLPPSRTEYKSGSYNVPALIPDISITAYPLGTVCKQLNCGDPAAGYSQLTRHDVVWFPVSTCRAALSFITTFRTVTSFSYGRPDVPAESLFVLYPNNISYKGLALSISLPNCLNDTMNKSLVITGDPTYGNLTENINIGASSPTASEYYAIINGTGSKEKLISYDIEYWRANIYMLRKTYVLLK
jgi:hypothetical protein